MRVVRLYHSGVVADWRNRERQLIGAGVDVVLLSPSNWPELGTTVELGLDNADPFVTRIRTGGHHPYRFVFGPRPLLAALRAGVDVVDLHEEAGSLAAAEMLAACWVTRRRRVPLVFYSAQNIYKRYPPPFRWIERALFRRASAAYVCNAEAVDVLRRKGFTGAIEVIPLGVDTTLFDAAVTTAAPDELVIGYAGRLDAYKGVDVLLAAIALVPEARLRIVGDGTQRAALVALAESLALTERVEFLGARPRAELPAFFRGLTALAVPSVPSKNWKEQFGRVAAEAMTVGTPVIASDSGSLPEVVGPGGIIVAAGDPPALAAAVREIAAPERRATLAAVAQDWARQFTWEAVAAKHLALYERAAI